MKRPAYLLALVAALLVCVSVQLRSPRVTQALINQADAPDWDVRGAWSFTWGNNITETLSVVGEDFSTGALTGSGSLTDGAGNTTAMPSFTGRAYESTVMLPASNSSLTVGIHLDGSLFGASIPGGFGTPVVTTYSARHVQREFVFSPQPQSGLVNVPLPSFNVIVQLTDGTPLVNFENTITLRIGVNPVSGFNHGSLTVKPVNGVAKFDTVSLDRAGSGYTWVATVSGGPLIFDPVPDKESAPFDVTSGQHLAFTGHPANGTANAPLSTVAVSVQDQSGATVTGAGGNVTLTLGTNPGGATLGGIASQPINNGVATFSDLTLDRAGTGYTLVATDDDASVLPATSAPFNVAGGRRLAFLVQPANGTPNTPLNAVQVAVQDASGATVASAAGAVSLALGANPGGATLGGTRIQPLNAGVATFSDLVLDKLGSGYSLAATDSDATVTGATSSPFDIRGQHLVFTVQPQSTLPDKALTELKVTLQDAGGVTVTKATGTVTLSLAANPGGSTLAGVVIRPLVRGVASFPELKLNKTGSGYTLRAVDSDATVGAAASAPFDITGSLLLAAPTDQVWANGHATATLYATAFDAPGVPGNQHRLKLTAAPALGVKIEKPNPLTGADGKATFSVTSTEVASVTFTLTDEKLPGVTATATVLFGKHKVVVLFLGIRTGLNCNPSTFTCQVLDDNQHLDVNGFGPVIDVLTGSRGFDTTDVIWYSYQGGVVDEKTGHWQSHNYSCIDTAEDYRQAIARLRHLMVAFSKENPNTDLYLVGHSQGGLIAFQSLGLIDQLAKSTSLKAVITLDSPLGGAPQSYVTVAAGGTCWKGPANADQVQLYNTASDHTRQGSTASLLCQFLGDCSFFNFFDTNSVAVTASAGTQVLTFGNTDDSVYNNASCLGNVLGFVNNSSSQVVGTAGGGLASLGGNVGTDPIACASSSHARVYTAHAGDIVQSIGQQTSVQDAKPTP